MLITFIIVYILATIIVGWWTSKYVKTSQDFAIAGRSMPTYIVATGLFATWFGSETIMGASSEFAEKGILGVIEDPFGAALCLLLIGIFFAKPLYKLNILTFSDYFRIRYDKKVEWISAIFMIPSYFSWIAAQLVALAIMLQTIVGIPFVWGIIICAVVVVIYTYIGGMWAVAITDTFHTPMIIVGLLVLMVGLMREVGGIDAIIAHTPKDFFRVIPREHTPTAWIKYMAAWATIGLGSIPQQDVFQRVLAAKSSKVAVKGAYWSAFMYFTIACMPLVIALCAKILYPNMAEKDAQMTIPTLVLRHSGVGMQIMFFGALLSAILNTCSGAILAPATVVGENLVKPLYGHKISDEKLLKIMRYSVIGIAIISVGVALRKSDIYELVGESSALSLVALFVPLVAGIYWEKANTTGAIFSILLGIITWIFFEYNETEIPAMVWGFLASILGMLAGSLIWRNEGS